MCRIEKNQRVTISYILKDEKGNILETASASSPLAYLHGHLNLVPGLEKALEGREPGEKLFVQLSSDEAYGPWQEDLVMEVPRDDLEELGPLNIGMEIELITEHDEPEEEDSWRLPTDPSELYNEPEEPLDEADDDQPTIFTIKEIRDDVVILDGNHPLAGRDLSFEVEVISIDTPTFEEIEQGYLNENEDDPEQNMF